MKYALVRFRWSYLEVGIGDTRSANRLLELLGSDGTLQLHAPSSKFPINYLVDSQTIILLSKMRNVIPSRNQTTWGNTATRLTPKAFYEPTISQQIAVRDLGGGAFIDFMDR